MSVSFFDYMKYARTGIASPDMTGFDKLRARAAFGGYPVSTITGVPPISFKADGKPLTAWSIAGNGQQTGTPTPQNIIMPDFCGVRTGNLFDYAEYVGTYMANIGLWEYTGTTGTVFRIPCIENTVYTLSLNKSFSLSVYRIATVNTDSVPTLNNPIAVTDIVRRTSAPDSSSFTTPAGAKYILFQVNVSVASEVAAATMLNSGSTALPYEPYGWAEKITCGGQTVPVYLGQVSTVRRIKKLVFDGSELWNRSTSGNNTRAYTPQIPECMSLSPAICTHFDYNVANVGYPRVGEFVINSSKAVIFGVDGTTFADVDAWKSYLAAQYAAGTPVCVWYVLAEPQTAIVNEPLAKIGDYADELHSTDAGVTIPTVRGGNTLTVDTTLQPSAMSVTGHIKPS